MSPLSKNDLKIQASDLRSFVASGRLLAIQFSRGETTETFFRNQTELIQSKASSAAESLRGAKTQAGLDRDLTKITELAHEVSGALKEMHEGVDAAGSAAKLDSLTQQLSDEEDKLK
jgi:hypothetical protein